jgi:hypothetical protein
MDSALLASETLRFARSIRHHSAKHLLNRHNREVYWTGNLSRL